MLDCSTLFFVLLFVAIVLCGLVLRSLPAAAGTKKTAGTVTRREDSGIAAVFTLPHPVIIVETQSLRLHAVNAACTRELPLCWDAGLFLPDLFLDADRVESFLKHFQSIEEAEPFRNGEADSVACLLKTPAGNVEPLSLSPFFIHQEPGLPSLLFLTVHLIAATTLGSMRRSFDTFPDILFFRDRDGRFLLCNKVFTVLFKKDLPDILGKTMQQLDLPAPYVEFLCAHDREVLSSGKMLSCEMHCEEQGRSLYFENRSYPDVALDGSIRGIFSVCRDISRTKTAIEAMQHHGTLLQVVDDAALLLFSENEDIETMVLRVLNGIGTVTKVDQVAVWRNHSSSEQGLLCTRVYTWNRQQDSCYLTPYCSTAVYRTELPGWEEILSSGSCVNTQLRTLSVQEQEYFEPQGLKAVLAVPIFFHASFWGFICLGVHNSNHGWDTKEEGFLRSVGLLLAAIIQTRQIQESLSESEEGFHDVTVASGEIIWELDAEGYFSYVSERMFTLTGYAQEEARGMRWEDFTTDAHSEGLTGRMFQASVVTGSFRALEHKINSKDGKEIWLLASGKLLIGTNGITGLRGTSLDITHHKQTTETLNNTLKALETANQKLEISTQRAFELAREAESASTAKSEFLANISHEVRTPLNAIMGMAYLISKTALTARQKEYVDKIYAAGDALSGLVRDVLDFSKMASDKLEIVQMPFELDALFETIASSIGNKAEEQDLDVVFSITSDVPRRLIGDPERIEQVLGHLVGNAVKFTSQGGVNVRCSLDRIENGQAHLRVVIRDTGIGISPEQQSRIFTSFSQVDASNTRKYGGTGLGLAIAKKFLQFVGGRIFLESAVDEGTTVTVLLPCETDSSGGYSVAHADSALLADASVILVTADEVQRAHLVGALKDMGCRVTACSDMEQGFAAASADDAPHLHIFVLPMRLVEEDNGKNIRRLQDVLPSSHALRVLAVAPHGFTQARDEATLAEVCGYPGILVVTRPLLSASLRAGLLRLLSSEMPEHLKASEPEGHSFDIPHFPHSKLLLVENDPANRESVSELLHQTGINVTVAENECIALALLKDTQKITFDLVLMAMQMREMDGFITLTAIRALPFYTYLPIIAMTSIDEQARCLEAGTNGHLTIPVDAAALYDILLQWLKPAQYRRKLLENRLVDDSPLPELPGLDIQGALASMNNDVRLYKTYLLQFRLYHADMEKAFANVLKRGDVQKTLRLVALVQQQARAIGANRLLDAAHVLKVALVREQLPDDNDVRCFFAELAAVLGMLATLYLERPSGAQSADENGIDTNELVKKLAKLNALLQDDDAAACGLFAELEPMIKQVNSSAAATAAKALSMFDFALALSVLAPVEKALTEGSLPNSACHA